MNPLSVVMGMTNVSFLAQTATWLPAHLDATIEKAWEHHGLSFVRVLQRCPVFMPQAFGKGGQNFPVEFLENEDGVPIHPSVLSRGPARPHDHLDLGEAQRTAASVDPAPMGLIYRDPRVGCYEEIRWNRTERLDHRTFVERLDTLMDRYSVS